MTEDLTLSLVVWSEDAPAHRITAVCVIWQHSLVVSGACDGRICVWHLTDCLKALPVSMFLGHREPILCIACGDSTVNSGRCVVADRSGKLAFWDCLSKSCIASRTFEHVITYATCSTVTWCGSAEEMVFCCGNFPEILALKTPSLEGLFCLSSRVEPDWISSFCLFSSVAKTDVIIGVTNSGFVKMWSLTNSSSSNTYIYEDESKQLQCYLARRLIISPWNPRSLLLLTSSACSIYDSSNLNLLCSCKSPDKERWLGGEFIKIDKVALWASDGYAYVYQLPRSLTGKAVETFGNDEHAKWLAKMEEMLLCCTLRLSNSCAEILVMDPAFSISLDPDANMAPVLVRGDANGRLAVWTLPTLSDQTVASIYTKRVPGLTVNAVFISQIDQRWKNLSSLPSGILSPLQPTATEKVQITCSLYLRNVMKMATGRSDGSLVIVPISLALRKQLYGGHISSSHHPQLLLQGHDGSVTCLLYPHQENERYDPAHLVSGGEDFCVLLWDLKTLVILHRFCVQAGPIQQLLVPPDNCSRRVSQSVCSIATDHSVALLNLKDQRLCLLASKHVFPVKSVHWRPADDFIMVYCEDGSLYVWQMETGHLDRILNGMLAEEVLVASAGLEGFVETDESSADNATARLPRSFRYKNLAAAKEIVEKLQQSGKEQNVALMASLPPPMNVLPVVSDGVVDSHIIFFNIESLIMSLLVVEHGIVHSDGANRAPLSAQESVESSRRSKGDALALERGNFCVEIAQLLLSILYYWGYDKEMDELCKTRLGLIQPNNRVSFGLISANRHIALAFPVPIATSECSELPIGEPANLITQQLLAVTSLASTLISMTYMSFLPELNNRRKLLKSSWASDDLSVKPQIQSENSDESSANSRPSLVQQLLTEQAEVKRLWLRVRAFHTQPVLEIINARCIVLLDLELLTLHWQDRFVHIREGAQLLLNAELKRIGSEARIQLAQQWVALLPAIVEPRLSIFGPTPFASQASSACNALASDDKTRRSAPDPQQLLEGADMSTCSQSLQMRRKQEMATVLLGIIGCWFSDDLMAARVPAKHPGEELLNKDTSIPFVTCQSLFECVVHAPNDALPLHCPLRRSCIDLLGHGFGTWQPYLDISKLVVPLLLMCAGIEPMVTVAANNLPQSAPAETARISLSALFLISHSRPSAFVTALSKEVARFASISQHQTYYQSSPLLRSQTEILSILESLSTSCYEELLDVMPAVGEILVHCLSVPLLKYRSVNEFCPLLTKFPMIAFSANTRRIAFGTKTGTVVVYELRAGKSQVMQAQSKAVSACCFSDDGKHLATYSSEESKLNIWLMAQSFLGMGQGQAKCIRQFPVPSPEASSKFTGRSKIVWISQKVVTLMLNSGNEHRFAL